MLARAFLRLCALEALRPSSLLQAGTEWPTLAGKYVSDSRIDPIDDVELTERRPLIAVYTEATHLSKVAQAGPTFYKGHVDLTFEISVVGKFATDGDGRIIDFAETDAETEAQLDALEDQIFFCLHFGPTGRLFRKMAKLPMDEWASTPHRSGEESIRLARRLVRASLYMQDSCYVADPVGVPANLARLPPKLKEIAEQLGGSTYLADLALGLARAASVMPPRVDLDAVGLRVDLNAEVEGAAMDVTAEIHNAFDVPQIVTDGPVLEIDYSRGTFQNVILTGNVSQMNVVNWPPPGKTARLILQFTNTSEFAVTGWPGATVWPSGDVPQISLGAGKRDIVVLTTALAGGAIFANLVGQDYK